MPSTIDSLVLVRQGLILPDLSDESQTAISNFFDYCFDAIATGSGSKIEGNE